MNLFKLPDLNLNNELITILEENDKVRVEQIISTGQTTGWYDQDEYEFVALIQGKAVLEFENNEIINLSAGDTITITPHKRHRVAYTSTEPPCVWLCVFW